jgi:hypothetical protein
VVRLGQEELLERRVQLERLDLLAPVDQVKINSTLYYLKKILIIKKYIFTQIQLERLEFPERRELLGQPECREYLEQREDKLSEDFFIQIKNSNNCISVNNSTFKENVDLFYSVAGDVGR